MAPKRLIKKVWTNFTFYFSIFDKQVNIRSVICSFSRPMFSRNHISAAHTISVDSYQSYFRKLDFFFFFGKQQCEIRTDRTYISFLLDSNDFQSSYIFFDFINNSTFFGTTEKSIVTINFNSTSSNHTYPNRDYY